MVVKLDACIAIRSSQIHCNFTVKLSIHVLNTHVFKQLRQGVVNDFALGWIVDVDVRHDSGNRGEPVVPEVAAPGQHLCQAPFHDSHCLDS